MNDQKPNEPVSQATPRLSVVVPTYRGGDLLRLTLRSLSRQEFPAAGAEIIVVDDGSPEFDPSDLPALCDPLRLNVIQFPNNRGRAGARNAGIKASSGDIVIFLDDDMTVPVDFLTAHDRFHRHHPGEVAIGNIRFADSVEPSEMTRYAESRGVQRYSSGEPVPFKCFVTGNSSVERQHLLNVGLFDEAFSEYGGEDLELGYRLHLDGRPFRFAGGAISHHHRGRSFDEMCELMYTYGSRSLTHVVTKHEELNELLRLDFLSRSPFSPRRILLRLVLMPLVYHAVRAFVRRRLDHRVPYLCFDYLWWYNRTRGFLAATRGAE
jgi:glycosyltransferase involved in cell wall biosynthesis